MLLSIINRERRFLMRLAIAAAALLVATMGVTGSAWAQDMDLMQFADPDGDGKVTLAEFTSFSEQGWGFFSQGADKVKVADLDPMAKPAFVGVTPDAEGFVTKAAYMAAVPARFKAADKDGDGVLSAAELNGSMKPAS
jgi:hypothetical protein